MKRVLLLTGSFVFGAMLVLGEEPKPQPKKAPVISDTLKAKFWKANSEQLQANIAAKEAAQKAQLAQVAVQAVVDTLRKECGDNFELAMVGDDVGCKEKPEPVKPAPAKEVKK